MKLMQPNGERRGFYVTVNRQDGLPPEVFINSGKAGDEANADSEALGRVVSIALQYGVPAEALENAGAANLLQQGEACPECGMPLRFEEGCSKCEGCGFSACG